MKNSEKRLKQISRMVDILGLLNKENRGYSRQELSEKFEVDIRSISRDISALAKEFPLHCDSETRKYRFSDGYSFKDIDLSPEEIRALLMCRLIASNIGEPVSNAIDSLMKKLKVEMGKKSGEMLGKVSTSYSFDVEHMENIPVSSGRFEAIQEAIEKNATLEIKYMSGEDNAVRMIDPYGLFFRMGRWYVVACDHQDREIEILPLLRIKDVKKTDNSYRIPSGFSVDDFVKAHPDKVHKEDLKELHNMLELLKSLATVAGLTSRKIYVDDSIDGEKRLNEKVRQIQTAINERNYEIRRLEKMKNEGKRIDTKLYEDLKALNYADAVEVKEHIQIRGICSSILRRGVVWDNRDNLSRKEVEAILKEAGTRINRINVSEEFKKSAGRLGNGELPIKIEEISNEIAKLESIAKE